MYTGAYLLAGPERDLLDGLISLASDDLKKADRPRAGVAPAGKLSSSRYPPTPAGADIEVNGVYLGSTSAEIEVEEGDPRGQTDAARLPTLGKEGEGWRGT